MVFREPGGWFVENPFSPPRRVLAGAAAEDRRAPARRGDRLARRAGEPRPAHGDAARAAGRAARQRRSRPRACARSCSARRSSTSACAWPPRSTTASPRTSRWPCASSRTSTPQPPAPDAEASRARLREAVTAAHRLVRARLVELSATVPAGSLCAAVEDTCERFVGRGLAVDVALPGESPEVSAKATAVIVRVLDGGAEQHRQARGGPHRGRRDRGGGGDRDDDP